MIAEPSGIQPMNRVRFPLFSTAAAVENVVKESPIIFMDLAGRVTSEVAC